MIWEGGQVTYLLEKTSNAFISCQSIVRLIKNEPKAFVVKQQHIFSKNNFFRTEKGKIKIFVMPLLQI